MTMSDGKNKLQKIAFQVGSKIFRFAINPDSYQDQRPHRTTAVKTKSRIVIEDFQSDVYTITISGSTGFNPTGKAADRGIAKIKELKSYLEDYAQAGGNGNAPVDDFYFHNFTNDESFVVVLSPQGVTYSQDVSSPLTYRYEIVFNVLRKAGKPSDASIVNPEIGNSNVSILTPIAPYTGVNGKVLSNSSTGTGSYNYNASSGNNSVYNKTTGDSLTKAVGNGSTVNPQAPSKTSYQFGQTMLGYLTGYYMRSV